MTVERDVFVVIWRNSALSPPKTKTIHTHPWSCLGFFSDQKNHNHPQTQIFGEQPRMVIWNKSRNWSLWVWMSMRRVLTYVIMMSSSMFLCHTFQTHVSLCSFCFVCVYQGWTPLHMAAFNGHKDTVELLIKHGANVNAQDQYVCVLNYIICVYWSSTGSKGGSGNVSMNSFSFLHIELLGNDSTTQLIVIRQYLTGIYTIAQSSTGTLTALWSCWIVDQEWRKCECTG